jgi:hypothetical protein
LCLMFEGAMPMEVEPYVETGTMLVLWSLETAFVIPPNVLSLLVLPFALEIR